MKRFFASLPGPTPVKVLLMLAIIVVALVLLIVVFEALGTFLDDGGAIG
jgi:hypothetical protein